jgi:hypothetical protein
MRSSTLRLQNSPALWRWFVYALVAETDSEDILVKVGATNDPGTRYNTLLVGMPYQSVMLYAPVRSKRLMFQLEGLIQNLLSEFHMRGEWFRFRQSDKARFHAITKEKSRSNGDSSRHLRRAHFKCCSLSNTSISKISFLFSFRPSEATPAIEHRRF